MKQPVADPGSKGPSEGMALPCGLASLALLFGVLGLLDESWNTQILGSRSSLHALFGLLLCTLVVVRFHRRFNWAAPASQSDIRELSRELSRMVYLSLYAVIGLRQIVGLADWLRHGGTMEFGKLSDGDLQAVVAYGIVGLLLIRVLAFGTGLHAARGAATMIDGGAEA
jgi:cytochrome b561